jgi:hypothetical protein
MDRAPNQRVCPEYRFEFNAHGMRRTVLCLPGGEQDFYGQQYFAGYQNLASAFAQRLSPRYGDLLELAVAIYLADRFAPRRDPRFRKDQVYRRRRIWLQFPVLDLPFWQTSHTQKLLRDALWPLTEDDWHFDFVERDTPLAPCSQQFLLDFPVTVPARVALFSGGLDSFAGAAFQLRNWPSLNVFVSGVTHGRMQVGQHRQMAILRSRTSADIRHAQVWYGLTEKKAPDVTLERSQRSRAFLHATLGAVATSLAGTDELYMYENGIGALNLPFDATQVGIETSKAASPLFHRAMERFIESVSGAPFRIVNPFQFLTKGQALRAAGLPGLQEGIGETFSCDRFPDWREGSPQCGTCASCLLRRLSLEVSGLSSFDAGRCYARDVKSDTFVPGDSAASILSHYEEQASRIEGALGDPNPRLALARGFPELYEAEHALLLGGGDEEEVRQSLLQLLRAHAAEWRTFSGRVALERYLEAA